MAEAFSPDGLCDGKASCGEEGKHFAIEGKGAGEIYRCDLRSLKGKPAGLSTCDFLFFCKDAGRHDFVLLLVELKDSRADKALKQLDDTAKLLCRDGVKPDDWPTLGQRPGCNAVVADHKHALWNLGIIVSPGGGREVPKRQKEIAKLRSRYNLRVLVKSRETVRLSLKSLYEEAYKENP